MKTLFQFTYWLAGVLMMGNGLIGACLVIAIFPCVCALSGAAVLGVLGYRLGVLFDQHESDQVFQDIEEEDVSSAYNIL